MSRKPLPLDVIADPVRRRVLERLDRQGGGTVDELAEAGGVHVNTVRGHLSALEDAGVVTRERIVTGTRGRPPLRYRMAPGWRLPKGDFKGLADLLAASVASLAPSEAQLDALGREWGRSLAARSGGTSARALLEPALAALGFEVEVDGDVVRLGGCPCRLVLPDRPELVCRLAAAVVDGVAAASEDRLHVRATAHDPALRRCELRLSGAPRRRLRVR